MRFLWIWFRGFLQPCGSRRLWTFGEGRLGFATTGFWLFYLFLPHVGMSVFLLASGIIGTLGWPFGLRMKDFPIGVCLFLIPVGGLFTAFTSAVVLGRQRVVLDRDSGSLKETFGLQFLFLGFLPVQSKRRPFGSFTETVLRKDAPLQYVVLLKDKDGGNQEVTTCRGEAYAREVAEEISRLTGLPMRDLTPGEPVVREAEELDLPLRDRVSGEGTGPGPKPPVELAAAYAKDGDAALVRIPRPAFRGRRLLWAFAIALAGAAAAGALRFPLPRDPHAGLPVEGAGEVPSLWPWRLAAAAHHLLDAAFVLFAITAGALALASWIALLKRRRGALVRAGRDGLRVRRTGLLVPWRFFLRAAELEELRLEKAEGRPPCLAAVSDRRIVRFGHGLSERELLYLRHLLERAVANPGWGSGGSGGPT